MSQTKKLPGKRVWTYRLTMRADVTDEEGLLKVRQILKDALGEFVSARGPTAAEYVSRRYGAAMARPAKISEVSRRCVIAGALNRAVDMMEAEPGFEDDED